jgi:hypothetical protein
VLLTVKIKFCISVINMKLHKKKVMTFTEGPLKIRGPGGSDGTATGYGLDGPGIESRWGRDFPHLSRPVLGSTQPPIQWVPGFSWGKERPGRAADPSPPSSAVVMNG